MPFRRELISAARGLLQLQNDDGGIPAVRNNHASGCWTTADVLYDILVAGILPEIGIRRVRMLVEFLLATQVSHDGQDEHDDPSGGWPLAMGPRPSVMATGQSVAALQLAFGLFDSDNELQQQIRASVAHGFEWLDWAQNQDGGWGTEPAEGHEGRRSTILATFYALLAYQQRGDDATHPGAVRQACHYLLSVRNAGDGSWSARPELPGDPCNTARALSCLVRAKSCAPNDISVVGGLTFIVGQSNPETGVWEVQQEPFFYRDAGGYINYHQNTICDVLVAFADCGYDGIAAQNALLWLLKEQTTSGLWPLSSPNWPAREIVTWSTAEWILALDATARSCARSKVLAPPPDPPTPVRNTFWKVGFSIGAIVSTVLAVGGGNPEHAWDNVDHWWSTSTAFRWIVGTIVVGAVVTAIGNLLSDLMRDRARRAKDIVRKSSKKGKSDD